ncbi:hypothetical protein [Larkinella soli]|uniref:hypothetical protein n=1 Tax=Larkinella soli TaxID=1770527 RepID=UPI000FFC00C3|nr:hypothetical protein [Larkinella soli]
MGRLDTAFKAKEGLGLSENSYTNAEKSRLATAAQKALVLFVSKYNANADYSDLPAAYAALPSGGGTIILDDIKLNDPPYTAVATISKPGVSLIGISPPQYDRDNEVLVNATPVIEGAVTVLASGFTAQNLVFSTKVVEGDNLSLTVPGFNGSNTNDGTVVKKVAKIYDCVFLGKLRSSAFHCVRIEDYQDVDLRNIVTHGNVWGIAIKANNVSLVGYRGKNHNFGPIIVKADWAKNMRNVRINDVGYYSTNDPSLGYTGAFFVQNFSSLSKLKDVTISNVNIKNGTFRFSNENSSPVDGLDGISVSNLTVDNSGHVQINCLYFTATTTCTGRIQLSNVTLRGGAANIEDSAKAFKNVVYSGLQTDYTINAYLSGQGTGVPTGYTYKKSGVANNSATQIVTINYSGDTNPVFLVGIGFQSTNISGSHLFRVAIGYGVVTIDALGTLSTSNIASKSITSLALAGTANGATKTITLSITQVNNVPEAANITYTLTPVMATGGMTYTPL